MYFLCTVFIHQFLFIVCYSFLNSFTLIFSFSALSKTTFFFCFLDFADFTIVCHFNIIILVVFLFFFLFSSFFFRRIFIFPPFLFFFPISLCSSNLFPSLFLLLFNPANPSLHFLNFLLPSSCHFILIQHFLLLHLHLPFLLLRFFFHSHSSFFLPPYIFIFFLFLCFS